MSKFLVKNRKSALFLGRGADGDELWLDRSQITTHMFVAGSTGSGKTEFLLNLLANTMAWGSGAVVIDGKGDISFFSKLHAIATSLGREDDLLLLNFSMANVEASERMTSHTVNPFTILRADQIIQIISGMIGSSHLGYDSIWRERAITLMSSIVKALTWLRDQHREPMTISRIRDCLPLKSFIALSTRLKEIGDCPADLVAELEFYLETLPGYRDDTKNLSHTALEQHGYLAMQWTRPVTLLASSYGHILDVEIPDIDIRDVVLNRRILTIMLPSLERSSSEIMNIGNLMVGMIKAMLGEALRTPIEGGWNTVVNKRITNAEYPFMILMDEVGQYLVDGMGMLAQQARSLNIGLVFATQDFESLYSKDRRETEAILANTNTKVLLKAEYPNSHLMANITSIFDMHKTNLTSTERNFLTDRLHYGGSMDRPEAVRLLESLNKGSLEDAKNGRHSLSMILKGFRAGDILITHGDRFTVGRGGYVDLVMDEAEHLISLRRFAVIENYGAVPDPEKALHARRKTLETRLQSVFEGLDQDQISVEWLTQLKNLRLCEGPNSLLYVDKVGGWLIYDKFPEDKAFALHLLDDTHNFLTKAPVESMSNVMSETVKPKRRVEKAIPETSEIKSYFAVVDVRSDIDNPFDGFEFEWEEKK